MGCYVQLVSRASHHRNRKHKACVFLFYKGSPALLTPRSGKAAEPLRANAPLRFAIPS